MPIAPLLQQSTGTSGCTAWVELDICMNSRLGLAFIISSEYDYLSLPALPRPAAIRLIIVFLRDIEPIYCLYEFIICTDKPAGTDVNNGGAFLLAAPFYDSMLRVPRTLPIGPKYTQGILIGSR
jgi:hypothetical protein